VSLFFSPSLSPSLYLSIIFITPRLGGAKRLETLARGDRGRWEGNGKRRQKV
jgi:hypothetical protein